MKILRYVLFFPGYALLWFMYYFPTERGKGRNVVRGGRSWRNRHVMAPIYTVLLLLFVFGLALDNGQSNQIEEVPR